MQIKNQDEILKEDVRASIIDEMINSTENLKRKNRELKKHEIYRDQNSKWVMAQLQLEGFRQVTLDQMRNRASNISICRKIINKLARTYLGGTIRLLEDENSRESVEQLQRELDFDQHMKKADRYRQLFRNCMVGALPFPDTKETIKAGQDENDPLWNIGLRIFAPWEYDVIEDPFDKTRPMVVILTSFPERFRFFNDFVGLVDGAAGRRTSASFNNNNLRRGDRMNQKIADSPEDEGTVGSARNFIWWSDKWHFTTNEQGGIIEVPNEDAKGNERVVNPIHVNPLIKVSTDQDGLFWAQGGEDVVDSSILINKQLTDINYITFSQGFGQLVIAGKDLPKAIVGGPDNALMFDLKPDDPTPQVFYATSNPPISAWLESIRAQLAMLLSTNNLSTKAIATKLDASTVESGIALAIQNAEVLDDLKDVRKLFQDIEPEIWENIRLWHTLYSDTNSLVPNLQEINKFESADVKVKFLELRAPISEKERLEEYKLRKELGISDLKDLIKLDNPDLTDDEVEERLEELKGTPETTDEAEPKEVVPPQPQMTLNVEPEKEEEESEEIEDGEDS